MFEIFPLAHVRMPECAPIADWDGVRLAGDGDEREQSFAQCFGLDGGVVVAA